MRELGTLEVQDRIYKKRIKRYEVTKGLSQGDLIARVNARPPKITKVNQETTKARRGRMPRAPTNYRLQQIDAKLAKIYER
jgi:hypothetical protein